MNKKKKRIRKYKAEIIRLRRENDLLNDIICAYADMLDREHAIAWCLATAGGELAETIIKTLGEPEGESSARSVEAEADETRSTI
jgi:hypothetical protein